MTGVSRWGGGAAAQRDESPHPHEAAVLALDSSKARGELNWRPALGLERALDWVVEWYKALAGGGDARALSLGQIARYQAMTVQ